MCSPSEKMEQIKAIENGKGIQYILDAAYEILGNPILAHDMDYKVMARTENTITDDPIWNELETAGMVGRNRLLFYRDECFFELAANAKKITFLLSDKLKYDRIYGKIFTKNNVPVGSVCIVACYEPFAEEDPALFGAVCDILTSELCKSTFYQNYGQQYIETLIMQLIEEGIEDIDLYTAHIENLYMGLKSNLHLAVADISHCDPACVRLAHFKDMFKRSCPDFKYAVYADHIVIIMSSDSAILHAEKAFGELYRLIEYNDVCVGISGCFENILELPGRYREAVNALKNEAADEASDSGQRIFLSDATGQRAGRMGKAIDRRETRI